MTFFTDVAMGKLLTPVIQNISNSYSPYNAIYKYYLESNSVNTLKKEIYIDLKTYMVKSILLRVDRMSMAHSLEVRVPF